MGEEKTRGFEWPDFTHPTYREKTLNFRQNSAVLVLFYTPAAKTMKAVFDDWAGELSHDEYKGLVSKLKERKFSHLVFSSRHPFGVKLFEPKK